ncbi:hypothetical protein TL16_g06270 [Triparma laevis f. inornata]|uniref:Uncharacterized protein n=1 Tax=Triparma laevis f. inornata TaxID=1714386 RepID=A0A9W7AL73_9STRA|nr:hypothetical protein TL16_g06270 [Triparma laevis f. inornata]
MSSPPSSTSHVSKRDLQSQLTALQSDVAELTKALEKSTPQDDDDTIAQAIVDGVKGKSFGELINDNKGYAGEEGKGGSFGNSFGSEACFAIDIPAGASTLLSQLARTQRALQDVKLERDRAVRELQEERERSRGGGRRGSRGSSPCAIPGASTTEALKKMRQLYESLEKDHQLMSLTLENSEKIRLELQEPESQSQSQSEPSHDKRQGALDEPVKTRTKKTTGKTKASTNGQRSFR